MAMKVSSGIVPDTEDPREKYWLDGATQTIAGVSMAEVWLGHRNMGEVASIVNGDVFGYCRSVLKKNPPRSISDKLARYAVDKAEDVRSLSEVISTARSEIDFITDPAIARSLTKTEFSFRECGQEPTTILIIIPPGLTRTLADYLRFKLACGLAELMSGHNKVPTLILCDEAYLLGRMNSLLETYVSGRRYKVRAWLAFQDLAEIKSLYGEESETLMNNAGVRQFLKVNDLQGSNYVSELGGESEVYAVGKNVSYDAASSDGRINVSDGISQHKRRLVMPQEVRNLGDDEQILSINGIPGLVRAKIKPYFRTYLKRRAAPNPYYLGDHKGIFQKFFGG
jgi:type IV secretory pathway TraG/TraD family ATPase VirD4